jgi:hypothetical protein
VSDWRDINGRLQQACLEAGLDLLQPFGVGHALAGAPPDEGLQDFGRPNALGVVIGNTAALWPPFTRAYNAAPELQQSANPLDRYVSERVRYAAARATSRAHDIVLSHVTEPRAYPIQRLAQRAGFSALSPCHLAIRSDHGLWFGLRAVVTFDCDGPEEAPPRVEPPCVDCSAPCLAALDHALAVTAKPLSQLSIRAHADAWIDVRRVCPVAQASRYGEAQLRYHYVHDPALLRDEP